MNSVKVGVVVLLSYFLGGCSAAAWQAVAEGLAQTAAMTGPASTGKLLVFGGPNNKTFLGCLSCGQYDTDSLLNQYGSFGSAYSSSSIANRFSQFGSKYSPYSACNAYASDPPIVVTSEGQAVGRLTVNTYNPNRIKSPAVLQWLAALCAD